jgi:hypothetical protein
MAPFFSLGEWDFESISGLLKFVIFVASRLWRLFESGPNSILNFRNVKDGLSCRKINSFKTGIEFVLLV